MESATVLKVVLEVVFMRIGKISVLHKTFDLTTNKTLINRTLLGNVNRRVEVVLEVVFCANRKVFLLAQRGFVLLLPDVVNRRSPVRFRES